MPSNSVDKKALKQKLQNALRKIKNATIPSEGETVDSVRVRINENEYYLQEVATSVRYDGGIERKMLKMSPDELESHKLVARDGALYHYDSSNLNIIASTMGLESKGKKNTQAFIMAKDGSLYMATHTGYFKKDVTKSTFTHASFLGGRPAECAGTLSINEQGKIFNITDKSGHYAPNSLDMYRCIKRLKNEMGDIFNPNCSVEIGYTSEELNSFLSRMETINPITNLPYHEELRNKRIQKLESAKMRVLTKDPIERQIYSLDIFGGHRTVGEEDLDFFLNPPSNIEDKLKPMNVLVDKLKKENKLNEFLGTKFLGEYTPLMIAVYANNFSAVELLVNNGADTSLPDKDGATPLHAAATEGNLSIVQYLYEKGSDINTPNKDGETPLHAAAARGNLDVVQYLHEKGSDINTPNKDGETPLHAAAARGNLDMMGYLLRNNANINHLNKNGATPLKSLVAQIKAIDVLPIKTPASRKRKVNLEKSIAYLIGSGANTKDLENDPIVLDALKARLPIANQCQASGVTAPQRTPSLPSGQRVYTSR